MTGALADLPDLALRAPRLDAIGTVRIGGTDRRDPDGRLRFIGSRVYVAIVYDEEVPERRGAWDRAVASETGVRGVYRRDGGVWRWERLVEPADTLRGPKR